MVMRGWFERALVILTAALAAVGFMLALKQVLPGPPQRDFDAYYTAARLANAGLPIYQPAPDSIMGAGSLPAPHREYVYPPLLAGLLRPIATLPYRSASLIWLTINVLLTGCIVMLLTRFSEVARRHPWWTGVFVLAMPATYVTWIEGQVSLLIGALILIAGASVAKRETTARNEIVSGFALGLAGAIKVYPVLLIPVFALHRRWRVVVTACATGIAATGVGVLLAGGTLELWYWFTHVLGAVAERPWPDNQSVVAVLRRLAPSVAIPVWTGSTDRAVTLTPLLHDVAQATQIAAAIQFVIALSSVGVMVAARRRLDRRSVLADYALAICAISLIVPVVWDHYYVQLLVPLALLADTAQRDRRMRNVILLVLLLILVQRFWRPLVLVIPSGLSLMCGFLATVVLWSVSLRLDSMFGISPQRGQPQPPHPA